MLPPCVSLTFFIFLIDVNSHELFQQLNSRFLQNLLECKWEGDFVN